MDLKLLRIEIERRLDFAVTQGISSATASSFSAAPLSRSRAYLLL
jgi:hypothetical protein